MSEPETHIWACTLIHISRWKWNECRPPAAGRRHDPSLKSPRIARDFPSFSHHLVHWDHRHLVDVVGDARHVQTSICKGRRVLAVVGYIYIPVNYFPGLHGHVSHGFASATLHGSVLKHANDNRRWRISSLQLFQHFRARKKLSMCNTFDVTI